jgi:tetratricopeptide (TPR) repeat protein
MNNFNNLPIALIGVVAIIAIAQPAPVFAISAQIPSAFVAAGEKAEDFFAQGNEKYEKGDYQGAIAAYSQAILLNPNYAPAYVGRGNARDDLGDNQGALADYNEALRINPNDADAYYNRGVTRSRLENRQGALADYNEALRINPNLAEAYYNRGLLRSQLGDKQAAIEDLQKAADLYQQQGNQENYQDAIDNLKKLQ